MKADHATIDDHPVEVTAGQTILAAAQRIGVDVPTLCHSAGLPPEGGCRMCLVETDLSDRPVAACHTILHPGMRVNTNTARLGNLRRDILALVLSEHEVGRFRPIGECNGDCNEVERLMARLGVKHTVFGHHPRGGECDDSHPYLRYDPSLCITCRRCLNACEHVQGQFVYDIEGRGADARLIFGPSPRFADSDCTACGACVDHCPTGAINDRDRLDATPAQATTLSVCGYCGVGCRVRIESADDRVLRVTGVEDAAVNRGHLCAKGRFAHGYHHASDRLTTPLLRKGGGLEPVSWEAAVAWLARRLIDIRDRFGPDTLGVMTSSRSTNEAAYLLQKLFRTAIGTNNVDCCARVCHSSTALALQTVTGTGAASASYDDIEQARCIVVAGANPTEAHPVVGARIKQAVLRGATLIVIDPRRIELAQCAHLHLPVKPGANVMLFNAIAKLMIEQSLYDGYYIDQRVDGIDELARLTACLSLAEAAQVTGVDVESIRRAATLLGKAGPALFVHGLGLSELTQGTASVMTLCNLGMLTGSIGRPGAGMLPLRGQNNVQGNADMGGMPDQVTGYQSLTKPQVRDRLAREWGQAPPTAPGLTVHEMLEAARTGQMRGLWLQGEDVAQSEPDQSRVLEALGRLDLLVVQDLFMSQTAPYAHLVLPAASVLEQEGTFTNGERRIQHVRPAVAPPGEARPDWQVAVDTAVAMGQPWSYTSPAEVFDEIARVAPALFGGVSYDRLETDGLQWPCPHRRHPGTTTVHADAFLRGRGQLVAVDFVPSPEYDVDGFPFLLITGRVLHHYNVGTMTRRTPQRQLVPTDVLDIHPDDAARLHIGDGDPVELQSRWGRTIAPAHLTRRVNPGTLFLSFHFAQTHANRLVGPHLDPMSKCPDYKVTAVRLAKASAEASAQAAAEA